MVEKMGRGQLTIPERIYWTFMHEMDHFQALYAYWQFMAEHIFEAVNTLYAEQVDCPRKITEIQNNIDENFVIATARSLAFDQYPRGLPMSGGMYAGFPFAPWGEVRLAQICRMDTRGSCRDQTSENGR